MVKTIYYTSASDNREKDPPVPIPNTEVKPLSADGTWLETARESRTLPEYKRGLEKRQASPILKLANS